MGRMVMAPIESQSFGATSGGDDVFELAAGTNDKLILHAFEITSNQDTAEAVTLRLRRRTTTGNGSAATPRLLDESDGSITAGMDVNVTTPGTGGNIMANFEWEQLGPLVWQPTPAGQIVVQEGGFLCLELVDNLAATQVWQGWVLWEEL